MVNSSCDIKINIKIVNMYKVCGERMCRSKVIIKINKKIEDVGLT